MKPHIIEIERLDGLAMTGIEVEIQGAMSVKPDPEALDGVYESKLRLSRTEAAKLLGWLTRALAQP